MKPKAIGVARAEAAFVIVGEELGLVGGHVDVDGAIAFAAFAGEAEVEGVLDVLALPAVGRATSPFIISQSRRARPRVECFSSRVTM